MRYAVWLKNHLLTKALDDGTLLKATTENKSGLSCTQPWGSKVWPHIEYSDKLGG